MSSSGALADLLAGDVLEVAPRLLGCLITHHGVTVRLTEVEAYAGADDPGSHAYRGPTRRNQVMFGPSGHLYCYLSHGIHICANVCVGPEGSASAVLLRAGEVVQGLDVARSRAPALPDRDLARGPGRLGRTLALQLTDDGADLLTGGDGPRLQPGPEPAQIASGPRVGLRLAADRPWRFWALGDPTVSAYRRSPRAPAAGGRDQGSAPS